MQIPSLEADKEYEVRVRAQNGKGWGYYSTASAPMHTKGSEHSPDFAPANDSLLIEVCGVCICNSVVNDLRHGNFIYKSVLSLDILPS